MRTDYTLFIYFYEDWQEKNNDCQVYLNSAVHQHYDFCSAKADLSLM